MARDDEIMAEGSEDRVGLEDIIDRDTHAKILFTGLDSAGKTSIILALQREISQIALLKPTRQAQRKIFEYLGHQIADWDLGGQARYRIAYLKQPDKYFDRTSVCIYVIDIQDRIRLSESLSYFTDVINQFKKLQITPLIYVFFHKLDPDFVKEYQMRIDGQLSEIKDRIRAVVHKEFDVIFVKTTIQELWTIISAFSQILLRLYPQSELMDKTVQEFAEKIQAEAMIILDQNSLVICQYFQNEPAQELVSATVPYFLTLNDSFTRATHDDKKMIVDRNKKVFFFNAFYIEKIKNPLYLVIMKAENDFPEDEIQSFIKMFKPLV
jgi:GTPase SAR1 family protein